MAKKLKFHQTLNQAPRSMKDGANRRASAATYRNTTVGTGDGTGGAGTYTLVQSGGPPVTFTGVPGFAWGSFLSEQPSPPAIPYTGIRTGEIIGHRLWWVYPGEHLCSFAHGRLWTPGETIEGDVDKLVGHPFQYIWGGVYAFCYPDQVKREIKSMNKLVANYLALSDEDKMIAPSCIGFNPFAVTHTFVSGTVKMWGEVVGHETGYRAQHAKLVSIDAAHGEKACNLDRLRAKYGV